MNSFENASSVYLFISRINHSCCPNCVAIGNKEKFNIRSIKAIPIGSEITISYIYLYYPFNERQRKLKEYNFICNCERCLLKNDSHLFVARCEQCENGKMYEENPGSFKC